MEVTKGRGAYVFHLSISINFSGGKSNLGSILNSFSMLGPYNTSDYPITIVVIPLINIVVPLLPPYCYYCTP